MKIYLIGLPGSGKSTIGKLLSKELNYDFIELDSLVEKESLMYLDELIDKYGMKMYEKLETEALENLKGENIVISCGSNIVTNRKNKQLLDGLVIYLDVNNDIIEKRLLDDYSKPLLKDTSIEDIYKKNFLSFQHFANKIVSNNSNVERTIEDLIEVIKQ